MLSLVEAFLGFFIRLLESNLTARRMFEAEISADAEKAARPQRLSAGNSYDLRIALELEEVSLVDVDVIRFLGTCQREGVCLLHCPSYISDWIAKERGREK